MRFIGGENSNATEASYKSSRLVAESGKDHTVAEKLITLAAKIMAQIMLGENTKSDKHQVFSRKI
jgi:hypothetical protein